MPLIILRDLFFSNLPDYFRQAEAFHKLNIVFHQMIFIFMRNGLALFQCKSNPWDAHFQLKSPLLSDETGRIL